MRTSVTTTESDCLEDLSRDPATAVMHKLARLALAGDVDAAAEYVLAAERYAAFAEGEFSEGNKPTSSEANLLVSVLLLKQRFSMQSAAPVAATSEQVISALSPLFFQ